MGDTGGSEKLLNLAGANLIKEGWFSRCEGSGLIIKRTQMGYTDFGTAPDF